VALCVQKILQFDGQVSQLRLHPNHLVTGSSAATYIFLLQHGNNEVVQQAVTSLIEELGACWEKHWVMEMGSIVV
jgi:PI-3-kinase-related kinase SMG-1